MWTIGNVERKVIEGLEILYYRRILRIKLSNKIRNEEDLEEQTVICSSGTI